MVDFEHHLSGLQDMALVDSIFTIPLMVPRTSEGCDSHRPIACALSLKAACRESVHDSSIVPTSPPSFPAREPHAKWPPLCRPCLVLESRSSLTLSGNPFDQAAASAGSSFSQLPVADRSFASLHPSLLVWPSPEPLDEHCLTIGVGFVFSPCFARLIRPTCVFVDLELLRGCHASQWLR